MVRQWNTGATPNNGVGPRNTEATLVHSSRSHRCKSEGELLRGSTEALPESMAAADPGRNVPTYELRDWRWGLPVKENMEDRRLKQGNARPVYQHPWRQARRTNLGTCDVC